jgi:hypothetical protein
MKKLKVLLYSLILFIVSCFSAYGQELTTEKYNIACLRPTGKTTLHNMIRDGELVHAYRADRVGEPGVTDGVYIISMKVGGVDMTYVVRMYDQLDALCFLTIGKSSTGM